MDFALYENILNQVKEFASEVLLSFGGESLLHPEILSMIESAKNAGLKVAFTTNATLLSEHIAGKIIESGVDRLSISFEPDPAEYEKIRAGADYYKTRENITRFLEIKKKFKSRKPYTIIRSVKNYRWHKDNKVSEKASAFKGLTPDRFEQVWAMDWAGDFKERKKIETGSVPETSLIIPCRRLWHGMAIRWDGKVVPCCRDIKGDYIVGDAGRIPLKQIWNDEKMLNLRKAHLKGTVSRHILCRNCDVVRYKKGEGDNKGFYPVRYMVNKILWKF
jgi:radical SAM protein with 4Fe4S-binding SPASM domain